MAGETFFAEAQAKAVRQGKFAHRDHLELTWRMLERFGYAEAVEEVTEGLRQVARAHGTPERYHETITQFWIRLLAHIQRSAPHLGTFEAMAKEYRMVLDKGLIERHWSREVLFEDLEARSSWVGPDRAALPREMQGDFPRSEQ